MLPFAPPAEAGELKMWTENIKTGAQEQSFEIGAIARQAGGAVIARQGACVLLATATAARKPKAVDFIPLTVDYRLRMAAGGRIPGGYLRREARSSDAETLISRLIDRCLRPLFPKGYRWETQLAITLLSHDPEVDPAPLAITASSLALAVSDIPFQGPVVGLRAGQLEAGPILLPSCSQRAELQADLIFGLSADGLVMAEGHASEISEETAIGLLDAASAAAGPLIAMSARAVTALGKAKRKIDPPESDASLTARLEEGIGERLDQALREAEKMPRRAAIDAIKDSLEESFPDSSEDAAAELARMVKARTRGGILAGRRLDGRSSTEIRPIECRVGWLPTPHGSALFTRGETQAIVTCTLGSDRDAQLLETPSGKSQRRFLLHYNFPSYSVGEVRPNRGPGRREIGHGTLARLALEAVMPKGREFLYTVRLESIVTESNGSSSMATVCGGCLALMEAGVPISSPVAGIAMGLVAEGDRRVILSDILGDEDHVGDMDFKVAGSRQGITAIQLDNKLGSLPREVMAAAFEQAREGRLHILGEMDKALSAPREELPEGMPRSMSMTIPRHRIGSLIGPGGRNIKGLEKEPGVQVSVGDRGHVQLFAPSAGAMQRLSEAVEELTGLPSVGEIYNGRVVSSKDFGVFVRIFEGIEALVGAEQLGGFAPSVGQRMRVKIRGVDDRGRIKLERIPS